MGMRSESPISDEMQENDKCVKFSMDQGKAGICYMVSVITLFRNEYTLLNKLEECLMDVNSERQIIVQPGRNALSKAVTKAKENGITEIFLENGEYEYDSEIVIDFTMTIIGASRDNTIVHTDFKVIGDSTEFSLKTITLYNSQTSGVEVNDAASFYIENVTFTEGMHHAVEAHSNSKGTLINCIVEKCFDSVIYCDGNAVVDIYGEKTEFKQWGENFAYGLLAADSSSKIVLHAPLTKQSILNWEYIGIDGYFAPNWTKRCGGNIVEDDNPTPPKRDLIVEEVKSKYKIVYEMVDFLTKDYSKHDFTKTCPIIPKSWQSAVSSKTGEVALKDINDGGDQTSLMLYILYSIHSAFPNIFKVNVRAIKMKNENLDEIFASHFSTFMTSDDNISLVHVRWVEKMDVCVSAFETLESPFQYPQVRGMLVTVGCENSGHVFAATVCEDEEDASKEKVFYCNSWGKGCVLASEIVQEMDSRCPKIKYVQYLLRK